VGETWKCPHCGELILRSAVSCPSCQRRLRFDAAAQARPTAPSMYPLRIEGVIHHPGTETAWEYSVLVEVRDSQGEIINRRVVGVGAVRPGETRTVTLQMEMRMPEESTHSAISSRVSTPEREKQETTSGTRPQKAGTAEPQSSLRSSNTPE